jgi:UDP-N-acetylmuramoylalanine--D-glutamate ligase
MAGPHLLVGFGVTNRAVCRALRDRSIEVVATDDRPSAEAATLAASLGVELVVGPDEATLRRLVASAERVVPTPGLPDHHPAMRLVGELGAEMASEFDLAAAWDERPVVAVTGTDGKTTVTTMVAEMLTVGGITAALAGNNDTPLVEAIADPRPAAFVVEASSFRIGHSRRFAPIVATWLNFAPDHLDVHADLAAYEAAKAAIFRFQPPDGVAITNADDPVVARHTGSGPARALTFGRVAGQYRERAGRLLADTDELIALVDDLPRRGPHDIDNALAAAATARSAGAPLDAIHDVLGRFEGLPHRVQLVAEIDGVRFVDDSKATVPHATLAAVGGLDRVVLIAGGRNKGLDLGELARAADRLIGVVAIGEAADDVARAFEGSRVAVRRAASMDDALRAAAALAAPGSTVLLSPACASHDWYANYAERGDDFARAVHALRAGAPNQ